MSKLADRLEEVMSQVEEVLHSSLEGSTVLEDMGTRLVEAGGKRVRPELLVASYLAGGGEDATELVDLAAAFELVHTASLIHDDITDDPTLRRRRPAPHRRYGLSRALIAGDFIFAKAFELMAAVPPDIARVVADAAVALAEGEHLELIRSFKPDVTKDEYEEIMEKKTASLFVAAARAGALTAGLDGEPLAALTEYARLVGLAFQMVDDVLDLEPSAALTGKPSGMDLREGRMNSVLFEALERLEGGERDTVVRVFMASSPPQADVDNALALVRGTGAGGISLGRAQRLADEAIGSLGDHFEGEAHRLLEEIALDVVRRRS